MKRDPAWQALVQLLLPLEAIWAVYPDRAPDGIHPDTWARITEGVIAGRAVVLNGPVSTGPLDMGARGGHARAAALSPERRSEIARAAANTRWKKGP